MTGVSPLNMALQPPPSMTKASVKYFRPVALRALVIAEGEFQVSTYGAAYWAGKPGPGLAAALAEPPVATTAVAAMARTAGAVARALTAFFSTGRLLSWAR